jgi:hypothetical protein
MNRHKQDVFTLKKFVSPTEVYRRVISSLPDELFTRRNLS